MHEGRTFQCPHCKYKANQKVNLKSHMQSVHEGLRFQCSLCEYKAKFKQKLAHTYRHPVDFWSNAGGSSF